MTGEVQPDPEPSTSGWSALGRWRQHGGAQAVEVVAVRALLPSDSPRLGGEDVEHIRALADSENDLPPIIVHRATMRIIDGMHRLQAAVMRGHDTIGVRFFDGDEDEAFVLAVESNVTHGLPLSMRDRTASAARIIGTHPDWSDRAIAKATGLSAKTVSSIRGRSPSAGPQAGARLGRDGRTRPLDGAAGRRLAVKLMTDSPQAPLRDIARAAGVSLSTAWDVRERLRRGADPVPERGRAAEGDRERKPRAEPAQATGSNADDRVRALRILRRDPSMRFTDAGRVLLRWLEAGTLGQAEWTRLTSIVAAHHRGEVADLARANAEAWRRFADSLTQR
ncbi:ParB/RepB/Spo0J family partition protein [Actinokineospora auranticolor]|uniref:ParB-like nuclease family protein n=1 Tax=Actinokineospora auranticolor TaxID=155976 RepID=A0A2S6GES9_9PSEU|nr:ParB/RepB/Spo0J family partition protein [Actinokineospora auranticolor]PPK63735.1 ParB-like nuclease family protein [Actinokineospora auranticolor]